MNRIISSIILLLIFSSTIFADSPVFPYSYKVVAPGRRFVFVMLAPGPVDGDGRRMNDERRDEIGKLRRQYAVSGMYRNDGSREPLWTVDWYEFGVLPMSDGIHIVRPGPWPWLLPGGRPDLTVEAVSFFADGKLLKSYTVGEFVDSPGSLETTVSHYMWRKEGRFQNETEYTIETHDGNRFVFDIRTGEIIAETRTVRWIMWAGMAAAFAIVLGLIVAGWSILRRPNSAITSGSETSPSTP